MLNEKSTVRMEDTKKRDAEEMVQTLLKLPDEERKKLFYMMNGIELTVDNTAERRAV